MRNKPAAKRKITSPVIDITDAMLYLGGASAPYKRTLARQYGLSPGRMLMLSRARIRAYFNGL